MRHRTLFFFLAMLFMLQTQAQEIISFDLGGTKFRMILVNGGNFLMGSDAYDNERPMHQVMLNSYYIGETEVTQEVWKKVMGRNPARNKGQNLPVENVSWIDCQKFLEKLSKMTGRKFRMPTEAEWEFAARGGRLSHDFSYSGSNILDDVAWYTDNSFNDSPNRGLAEIMHMTGTDRQPHPVAQKMPNELGLYDMCGNVYEWCQDWFGRYPSSLQQNPKGIASGRERVCRGGCWSSSAQGCRVTERGGNGPKQKNGYTGLRLVMLP